MLTSLSGSQKGGSHLLHSGWPAAGTSAPAGKDCNHIPTRGEVGERHFSFCPEPMVDSCRTCFWASLKLLSWFNRSVELLNVEPHWLSELGDLGLSSVSDSPNAVLCVWHKLSPPKGDARSWGIYPQVQVAVSGWALLQKCVSAFLTYFTVDIFRVIPRAEITQVVSAILIEEIDPFNRYIFSESFERGNSGGFFVAISMVPEGICF